MSPRTKEQNEAIREARIRQILLAAADVYLTRGMAFEMRDVAAHAGLGYGTVYHYYSNKYQLFRDLLLSALDAAADLTERALSGRGKARERLRTLAVGLLKLWVEEPMVFILYKMASENFHQLPSGSAGELPERFEAELYQPVAEALREATGDANALDAANVLIGSLIGSAGLWLYHRQAGMDAERTADLLFEGIARQTDDREER
ncbi:TetR/AcrR family transcriptional regulator [Cohnella thermotolerans]|uniref:TetR/AcrR family transcriptional regulator n=1 Tax=Cohnella thermotolerans TaxID=329858 RepID=UPI0004285C09|nr:TetR/AcrR family transcriptional regulator [Cohnella thermotolerans]